MTLFFKALATIPAFCIFAHANLLIAQQSSEDLHRQVRNLSSEQKLQMLGYLRHAGGDIDQEIVDLYKSLPAQQQSKSDQYIRFLKQDPALMPRTQVAWNRDTLHFGVLEEGAILIDSFTVRNVGSAPYVVHDIRSACDCTVLQKPQYPVFPGESLTLRVEFNTKGKAGDTEAGVVLFDNSSPNARNILYIVGRIVPRR